MRDRECYGDIVAVSVGENRRVFKVHKDILVEDSKYFRATFQGHFSEADSKEVHLPDIELETFQTYVHWMYTGEVIVVDRVDDKSGTAKESYGRIIQLYIAADRLENARLRNDTMTKLLERTRDGTLPAVEAIRAAYQNTIEGSTLRRYVVDARHAQSAERSTMWLKSHREELPLDFIVDYANALALYKGTTQVPDARLQPKCWYHEHNGELPYCQ